MGLTQILGMGKSYGKSELAATLDWDKENR